ncbi:M20/M25/M40 family metallo-hydrolase [Nakamurella sp.]|uniref:M20/M25/M40 family metallo-hydrolase n=1 Tax=Nakamurella sp. TaxID=1869182 RepID=UPI003B3AF279
MPDLLEDLERLVRCESPSADLAAVARSAEVVAEIGERRLGVPAQRLVVDGCSHLALRHGTGPVRVLLLAHHDTVWPVGSLAVHPWSNRDGVIRGPGTVDMKAGLAMGVHALALLAARGADLAGVCLLVTGDEEVGSLTSRALIEDHARTARGCLVLEGAAPHGALKTGRKGTSWYRIDVTGRAAHAGGEPEKGVNAAVELAHLVLTVAELGRPDVGTTVTPTVASAGTTTNTVPAAAELHVDVRARTAAEQQRVHARMLALTATVPGAVLTVHGGINRPPMEPAGAADLFAAAVRLADREGLGPLAQRSVGGGSDGNFTAAIGVPTLDGLGAVGGGAHAADEHVLVEQLAPRTALLAALVEELLGS